MLAVRMSFRDLDVLDLFAGFGTMGFEALSRGAASVCFVDRHPDAVRSLQSTAERFQVSGQVRVVRSDVTAFLERPRGRFGLVFCDPPYTWPDYHALIEAIVNEEVLAGDGLLLVEHCTSLGFQDLSRYLMHRDYGMTRVTFFQQEDASL